MSSRESEHLGDRLQRSTTAEEVAGVLRELIMGGEIAADAALGEAALSERFEVSRRTVRDALGLLEHEGLVRHHRHKGSRVTRLEADDIRDLYRVRRTMELAAAQSVERSSAEGQAALTTAFERLSDATRARSAPDIVSRDLEFHQAVVGLLGSPRFDSFFAAIAVEMRYALSILESSVQESTRRPRAALAEHRAIYEALIRGDREKACALVLEHTMVNEELLLHALHESEASVDDVP